MKIAFIGLGNMGGGMAANLVKAGHEVRAFDLAEEALERSAVGDARMDLALPRLAHELRIRTPVTSPPRQGLAQGARGTERLGGWLLKAEHASVRFGVAP